MDSHDSIFVILQKTVESEYGYGGWTGRETEETAILGYVHSQQEADEQVTQLAQKEKCKKKRLYKLREFDWERVSFCGDQ